MNTNFKMIDKISFNYKMLKIKEPIIIFNHGKIKDIHQHMINSFGNTSVKILKQKQLYKDNFNKWYHEGLKYVIIKLHGNKMDKLSGWIKSLIYDSQVWIKNDECIDITPHLKFIIISKKPLLLDPGLRARTKEI